jgi:uncharacterized protein (TIGR02271 family)
MVNTVVGLLDDRAEAEEVVEDLISEGFDRDDIHVVANEREFVSGTTLGPGKEKESGFHNLMVKLGFLEDRREELGLPAEDVGYYSEGVRRGGVLVTIDTDESEVDRAIDILEEHGAVNIEERAQQWRQSGWTGPIMGGTGTETTATMGATAERPLAERARTGEEARIPVVEEELKVGKRAVERGGVRVYTHVTETPVSETVSLREEHVNVERRPVDRPLTGADTEAFREGAIELTETAEEAVASKEARVVEEVVVSKDVTEHAETVKDTVRRTDVEVEELPPGKGGKPKGKL